MDDDDNYFDDYTGQMGSDDPQFQELLENSRIEYEFSQSDTPPRVNGTTAGPSKYTTNANSTASSSRLPSGTTNFDAEKLSMLQRDVAQITTEISDYEEDIRKLHALIAVRKDELGKKKAEIAGIQARKYDDVRGKGKAKKGIDYSLEGFPWMNGMKARMKQIFGIESFRLCQQGVCNANMDGRDIVCVMPTGGGKSLTYQLPALLAPGVALVISPLLSLISDQIMHLRDAGVDAVKLTSSTTKTEADEIDRRLKAMASGSSDGKEIKLVYVTPEKIAKSKRFIALLQKLDKAEKLVRIVIDEAHCVSQLGHDFRPDYQKLRVLRQLFPRVPIMALSATCPPLVLKDLLKILGLKGVTHGTDADTQGTVYFSAPLYRKNLHYAVVPKAGESNKVMDDMTKYILENHKEDSGIVYCFSKKDTEKVAAELLKRGGIKTGVYHADRTDREKEDLHRKWRQGSVKVVCATIAFGLGIDKGDVRFVLHHSISKSLDGFYQESGRAGRDGGDSDCVLYYRPQDASNLSSMMFSEKDGPVKLHAMLAFAQDLEECRKLQFAKYFSHSSDLSLSSWGTSETGALDRCGHCDNCLRVPENLEKRDVTYETWQILKLLEHVTRNGGDVTMKQLAEMARGVGSGIAASGGGGRKGKGKEKMSIDMDEICGGKIDMKQDDTERLIVELLIRKYLKDEYHTTAYSTTAYLKPGDMAIRLTRLTKDGLQKASVQKLECVFLKTTKQKKDKAPKGKGKQKETANDDDGNIEDFLQANTTLGSASTAGSRKKPSAGAAAPKKRSRNRTAVPGEDEGLEDAEDIIVFDSDIDEQKDSSPVRPAKARASRRTSSMQEPITIDDSEDEIEEDDSDEDEDMSGDWSFNYRSQITGPPRKKRRTSEQLGDGLEPAGSSTTGSNTASRNRTKRAPRNTVELEVLELSD